MTHATSGAHPSGAHELHRCSATARFLQCELQQQGGLQCGGFDIWRPGHRGARRTRKGLHS
jgi:hypothetical protein